MWRVTIDVHDDGKAPGENHYRIVDAVTERMLFSDAVEQVLDSCLLIHEEPGKKEFQITVTPCE